MKRIIIPIVALCSALFSCVNSSKRTNIINNNEDSLILSQDTSKITNVKFDTIDNVTNIDYKKQNIKLVRVISAGIYDTIVNEKDLKKVQEEHHKRYYNEVGPYSFHSCVIDNGDTTHYSCSHHSHISHGSHYSCFINLESAIKNEQ